MRGPDDTDQVSRRSHPIQLILKLIVNSVEAMSAPLGIARVVYQEEKSNASGRGLSPESLARRRVRSCLTSWISSSLDHRLGVQRGAEAPLRANGQGGSHFKICWTGKLVIGDHVTGFLIIAAVGAASGLIQISSARPSRPLRAQRRI